MRTPYKKTVRKGDTRGVIEVTGWYIVEGDKTWGMCEHVGSPWDVDAMALLPVDDRRGLYSVKVEVDDTGTGKTGWHFEFRKADIEPESIRMSSFAFWDKVSMTTVLDSQTDRMVHTYLGRKVTGITIHLEPRKRSVEHRP